jgi:hypothetical protein
MTGTTAQFDFGTVTAQSQIAVWNSNDPIVQGIASLTQPVTVLTGSTTDSFNWGNPGGFASLGANLGSDINKGCVFSYEAGTNMPGISGVPARRVGLFLTANTAVNLNDAGWSVVDAAVRWCAGAPEQIQGLWLAVSDGQVTLNWNVSSGATTYSVQMGTSAGSLTTIATGVSGTTYTIGQLTNGSPYFFNVTAFSAGGQSLASVTIQGTPEPSAGVVAITGTKFLQRKKQDKPQDHFNTRTFAALVWRNSAQATNLVANNPNAAAGDAWAVTGPATILNQTLTTCQIQAKDATGDAILTYQIKINIGTLVTTGQPIYEIVPMVTCQIRVDLKFLFALKFHFPNDGASKRTQRDAYPSLFFNEGVLDDSTRQDERVKLANDLIKGIGQNKGLEHIWDQSGIDFYPTSNIDNNPDEKIDNAEGIWDGNTFIAKFGDTPSPGMEKLQTMNIPSLNPSVLNVYLVHSVKDFAGWTTSQFNFPGNPAIVISDEVTPAENNTLAHEIGHALGLAHSNSPNNAFFKPIEGTVNNLWPIYGANSVNQYLMFPDFNRGTLISEYEAIYARKKADTAKQGAGSVVGARE